jgi:hypothetical protein
MTLNTLANKIPLSFVARAFSELFPIQSLVHVGYGTGRSDFSFWKHLSPQSVFLIDAKSIVNIPSSEHFSVKCVQATLSAEGGTRDWTHSQLLSEDSLLSEKAILSRWPHVKGLGVMPVNTLTLDSVLSFEDIQNCNWLLIDCHPAHEVLKGSNSLLSDVEVVLLRSFSSETEFGPAQSSFEILCQQLNDSGLKIAYAHKHDNDLIIDCLFVRFDYKKRLALSIESSNNSLQVAFNKINQSFEVNSALSQTILDLKQERDQLRIAVDTAAHELGAIKLQATELQQERPALLQTIEDLQQERDQLRIAVDTAAHELGAIKLQATELQQERPALLQTIEDLQQERDHLKSNLENSRHELELSKSTMFEMEKQNAEILVRQQMIDKEMAKAEVQINLLKDLLHDLLPHEPNL